MDEFEFPPLGAEAPKVKHQPSRNALLQPEPAKVPTAHAISRGVDGSEKDSLSQDNGGDGFGKKKKWGRRRQAQQEHYDGSEADEDDDGDGVREWKTVVLDTSALLWAPQGVRRIVRLGWEIVIPSEGGYLRCTLRRPITDSLALRTLDLLKSGSSPSARAARSATRFIEHSSRHYKVSVNRSSTVERGRGVRIQQDSETRSPDSVSSLAIPVADGDVLPKWMENVLGCAAYFMSTADKDNDDAGSIDSFGDSGAVLYVANPPLNVEVEEGFTGNIGQRGEGYLISQEAERFEIPIGILRDEEDEIEQERKTKKPQRGKGKPNGRGRGGGRNVQRAKEDTSEREVKILLRRPADEGGEIGSPKIPAPELSSPSSAHRSPLPAPAQVNHAANQTGHGSKEANGIHVPPPQSPRLPPPFIPAHAREPPSPSRPSPTYAGPHGRYDMSEDRKPQPPFGHPPGPSPASGAPPPRGPRELYRPPSDNFGGHERGRGRGRGGGGGRGRGRGRGGAEPSSGDFVLLQRPGPPPREERMGGGASGPKVVLLQRPK